MNEITRTGWDVLDQARTLLRAAVAGVPADGWQRRDAVHRVDRRPGAAARRAGPGGMGGGHLRDAAVRENPFAPSGELGAEPLAYAEAALEASRPGLAVVSADGGPVPTPLPTGPMPPADAAAAAALDAAIHAWDIAMATGQGSPLTPDLARALTPVAKSIVEPLRQYGVYAAEMEAQAGADDAAALLCYLGRSPAWLG